MTLRHAYRIFWLATAGGLSGYALAQAEPTLPPMEMEGTLVGYLQQAAQANPQLQSAEQYYQAALHRIPQASALPDPMFQVTHFVESVQTRTGPQEHVFMLSQKIPWFGKLSGRKQMASAEAEALWYAWQSQNLDVARRVALAFYEYANIGEAMRLTNENRNLLQKLEPIVEQKVGTGAEMNALLRLKVEIGKVEDRFQSIRQQRIAQSAQLVDLLALPSHSVLPFPLGSEPEAIALNPASLMQAIQSQNPELKLLERRIHSAEARRELARLESWPDLSLGLNYIEIGDPVTHPSPADAGQDAWGFTVALTLPIWLEKSRSARAEALAMQQASEYALTQRLNQLQAELSASLARLDDANRRLKLYGEELLNLAEQAAENSRSSYESGRVSILEVIDSERSLLDLQLLYWRAATDAWQQRVVIQTLTNQPLSSGISNATHDDE